MKSLVRAMLAAFCGAGAIAVPLRAIAQSAEDQMRLGNEAVASLSPALALQHFESVIAMDSVNFDALCRASMAAVELGEAERDREKRIALYRKSLDYAQRGAQLRPHDPEAHFQLSVALGVSAMAVGVAERVKYAREIRDRARAALALDPNHPGALHVLAMWHAELLRISGVKRLLARTFLGAEFMAEATWEDATRFMERSAQLEPARIRHHFDLARIYRDRGMLDKAIASYSVVLATHASRSNDTLYKKIAATELAHVQRNRSGVPRSAPGRRFYSAVSSGRAPWTKSIIPSRQSSAATHP